jgi:hypothetical protein
MLFMSFNYMCACFSTISAINVVRFKFIAIYFAGGSCLVNVICIYLHILVSNTISISHDVRVA